MFAELNEMKWICRQIVIAKRQLMKLNFFLVKKVSFFNYYVFAVIIVAIFMFAVNATCCVNVHFFIPAPIKNCFIALGVLNWIGQKVEKENSLFLILLLNPIETISIFIIDKFGVCHLDFMNFEIWKLIVMWSIHIANIGWSTEPSNSHTSSFICHLYEFEIYCL